MTSARGHTDLFVRAGSRRLADSNCCKRSEHVVHVNAPQHAEPLARLEAASPHKGKAES